MDELTITITEGERQAILLALAHLAVERPGWDHSLAEIALRMDNRNDEGRPQMFDGFKSTHRAGPWPELALKEQIRIWEDSWREADGKIRAPHALRAISALRVAIGFVRKAPRDERRLWCRHKS